MPAGVSESGVSGRREWGASFFAAVLIGDTVALVSLRFDGANAPVCSWSRQAWGLGPILIAASIRAARSRAMPCGADRAPVPGTGC
jgi:hypothetical protein